MDNQFENNPPVGTENDIPPVQKKTSLLSRLKKPLVLIPVAGAAAVVLCVGAVSANTSKAVTNSAIKDLGGLVKDTSIVSVLTKSYDNSGRVTVTVEEGDLLPTDARIDLWMNSSDSRYVLKASAVGEDVSIYLSDTDLIGETSILSETYGLSFENLFDDMKNSEWFGEFRDEITEMEDAINTAADQISDMKKVSKDGEKLINKYYEMLFEAVFDNAEVSSESESGNRIITIVVDGDCISKSIDEVWRKAAKDKKLIRYLDENLNVELLGFTDYDSWKEILSDPDIREDVCTAIERLDFEFEVQITASSIAHDLKKLKISMKIENQNVGTVTLDRTEKNVTKFKVASGGRTYINARLTEDGDNLSGKLEIMEEEVLSFKWDYVKKEKKFKLTVNLPTEDVQISLKGDYESSGKRFYLKAKTLQVESDGESVLDMVLNVSLEIVTGEKAPAFPKSYTNVFDLTENDLTEIQEELERFAKEFENSEDYQKLSELFDRY